MLSVLDETSCVLLQREAIGRQSVRHRWHQRKGTNEVSVDGLDSVVDAVLRSNLLSKQLCLVDLLDVLRCRLESLGEVVLGELANA